MMVKSLLLYFFTNKSQYYFIKYLFLLQQLGLHMKKDELFILLSLYLGVQDSLSPRG